MYTTTEKKNAQFSDAPLAPKHHTNPHQRNQNKTMVVLAKPSNLCAHRVGAPAASRLTTKAVLTPGNSKASKKQLSRSDEFPRDSSALALLGKGGEMAGGLYGTGAGASALEQASSLTAAYRALLSAEDEGESSPGVWEKLTSPPRY